MPLPGRLVLLGHPVSHSLSPRLQNAALDAADLPLRYEAIDIDPADLHSTLAELRAARAAGNVTIPHKQRVAAACDEVTPLARRVGAVNTFWVDTGKLHGDNTDVGGFTAAASALLGKIPSNVAVGVLGAGGAAAAVLAAIESWRNGSRALIYNRTLSRAQSLCARFRSVAEPIDDVRVLRGVQLVVNATSVGLHDDALPLDLDLLPRDAALLDLVYRRGETAWIRAARDAGHRAADGLTMLVEQAALAFERWFGRPPDRGVMWRAVR